MRPFIANGQTIKLELLFPLQISGNKIIDMEDPWKLTIEAQKGHTDDEMFYCPPENLDLLEKKYLILNYATKIGDEELGRKTLSELGDLGEWRQKGTSYRFVEGALPSHEELISWIRRNISLKANIVPEDMECALDNFLDAYSSNNSELPMVSIYYLEGCLSH